LKKISERNVIKNASWVIISKIFQAVLQILILMLVARYLGPADFGIISYAISLVVFVTPIAFLGLNNTLVHEIISNSESEGAVLGTSITLSIISSFFCGLLVLLFVSYSNSGETKVLIVCALYSLVLIFQALEFFKYWFQAKLLSKYTSIISLAAYIIVAAYNATLFVLEKNIYWFSISNVLVFMMISISLLILYFRLGGGGLSFSVKVAGGLWRKAKHFILPSVMVAIYAQSDRVMIQQMIGDESVGLYSAALSAASMASFLFVAIIDSFRPLIFTYYEKSKLKFEYYLKKIYSIVIYLSLCQAVLISFFSESIINILFGEAFLSADNTLAIICWYIMFSFLGSVRNIWILSNGLEKYLLVINMIGALFNVILNFILIPLYGIEGAATASLITQIITNFVITYFVPPMRGSNLLIIKGTNPKYLRTILKRLYQMSGLKR